jgi:hypothetical protein
LDVVETPFTGGRSGSPNSAGIVTTSGEDEGEEPGEIFLDPGQVEPTVDIDSETLVTTVSTTSFSTLPLEALQMIFDPQNWTRSPFWKSSVRVVRGAQGFELSPVDLGTPWPTDVRSWCFEHVRWEWNDSSLAEFQNFLNITFEEFEVKVGREQRKGIQVNYSLHSCQGSLFLARFSPQGVNVDHGFLRATPVTLERLTAEEEFATVPGFKIETLKRIRFSEIEDKRTSFQGIPGTSSLISFLAPASMKLWMKSLIESIYEEEKRQGVALPQETS